MIQSPPDTCPECGYRLTGLPAAHRCPECGFEYDEHTVIFRPSRTWTIYALALALPAFLAYLFSGVLFVAIAGLIGHRLALVLCPTVAFCVLLLVVVQLWRSNRRGRFVAVTPAGIVGRTHLRHFRVPWSGFGSMSTIDIAPWIKPRGDAADIKLPGIFDNQAEKDRFREAVETARRRYP